MVVLGLVLVFLAGITEAVMDTVQHHYYTSVFSNKRDSFWNPTNSWSNKYKNGNPLDGPAFIGSTTVFVFVTDAWHLYKFFRNALLWSGLIVLAFNIDGVLWVVSAGLGSRVLFGISFEVCYKWLFRKRFWR